PDATLVDLVERRAMDPAFETHRCADPQVHRLAFEDLDFVALTEVAHFRPEQLVRSIGDTHDPVADDPPLDVRRRGLAEQDGLVRLDLRPMERLPRVAKRGAAPAGH